MRSVAGPILPLTTDWIWSYRVCGRQ